MSACYSAETAKKTANLIYEQFHVSPDYAQRLAIAALDGIEAHGGDSSDWKTIEETVTDVVASWVENGALN